MADRKRPSNPMQGDDVFRSPSLSRHSSPLFGLGADDGEDFWANLDERHAQHRQHLIWLAVAFGGIALLGLLVHPGFFVFALALLIPIAVEAFMFRRTRSTSKIPDYRPSTAVEIDLDRPDDPAG